MRILPVALILLAASLPVPAHAQRSGAAAIDTTPHGAPVVELDSLSVKPTLLNRGAIARLMERHYPEALRDGSAQGQTTVVFLVDPSGVPRQVTVTGSSGFAALDEAALLVTRAMRFSPPMLNGSAVWARVVLPVSFARI